MGLSFKGWLRRIMINSAIDYFRRNEKHYHHVDIIYAKADRKQIKEPYFSGFIKRPDNWEAKKITTELRK